MTDTLDGYADVAERLRTLAATAGADTKASHDLASAVLTRRRVSLRRQVRRLVGGTFTGLVVVGGIAAATLPHSGAYFAQGEPSAAMSPTVRQGEILLTGKKLHPERGDLVVYRLPGSAGLEVIGRVIGLPGDELACPAGADGQCRAVTVNGRTLSEPYLQGLGTAFPTELVPAGDLYVLGDNRSNAVDSRSFGPIHSDGVKGVGVRIIDAEGRSRVIPGAPSRRAPGGSDNTDPMGPVPPAAVEPAN
ncbi:MAG: signal peptidase [Frankiales bacterium]|jgi:signal peptidase I|nr:signal peptidase [Frankiales bacterium]